MDEPPPTPRSGLRGLIGKVAGWMRTLPRAVLWAGAAVVGAGLAAVAFAGYTVYDYTMNNPAFCRSCHIMEAAWTRWSTSEHRKVDCHACHEQSIVESSRQVITFVVRRPERVGRHAVVPGERCAVCHESGDARWRQVAATAGHQVHAERQGIQCVICHSQSVHRIQPSTQICAECHRAQATGARAVKIPQMAEFHCVDCHQFLRLDSPLRPTRQTCLQCHQTLPPRRTVGFPDGAAHSTLPCGTCHKPHEQARPIVACTTCHVPTPEIHAAILAAQTPCTTCHQPHRWKLQ